MEPTGPSGEKALRVRRGRVDSVDLYEIKESELDLLEHGSPGGIYLNFSIFLLSTAFTAIASLCTSTFSNSKIETVFLIVAVVGLVVGALLLFLWWRAHQWLSQVVKKIRCRIPPDQIISTSESAPAEPPHS